MKAFMVALILRGMVFKDLFKPDIAHTALSCSLHGIDPIWHSSR